MVDAFNAVTVNSPVEPSGRTVNWPAQSSRSATLLWALKRYLFSNFGAVRKSVRSNSIGVSVAENGSPRLRSWKCTRPPCTPKAAIRSAGRAVEAACGFCGAGGASFARLREPSRLISTCTTGRSSRTSFKLQARCSSEALKDALTRSRSKLAIG